MLKIWITLLALIGSLMYMNGYSSADELKAYFFNAGKADACLMTTANSVVLIDAGKHKMGKEIVSYLDANGIDQIDVMFITHFDKDHVGGADKVMEAVQVKQVYEPAYFSDSKQFEQYREALLATQTPYKSLSQNHIVMLDDVAYRIDVANRSDYGEDEENDFSLVISVQHGNNKFLFAGDAENARLTELLTEGVYPHNVLKVPHHGKTEKLSASFFAAVSPELSVVTSDEDEPEDAAVVRELEKYGEVLLTREGAVTIISDGKFLTAFQE